jgi:hypothetical protein
MYLLCFYQVSRAPTQLSVNQNGVTMTSCVTLFNVSLLSSEETKYNCINKGLNCSNRERVTELGKVWINPMEIVSDNSAPLIDGQRGRPTKHRWDQWLQHGKTVRLIEGVDFVCKASSIRQQAYNRAMDKHGTVQTRVARTADGTFAVEITFWNDEAFLMKQAREAGPIEDEEELEVVQEDDDELPMVSASSSYGRESLPPTGQWGPPSES